MLLVRRLIMKRAAAFSYALLFGSLASSGQAVSQYHPQALDPNQNQTVVVQSPGASQTRTFIVQSPALTGACPVSLRAQQAAGGGTLAVDNARPKGPAQRLHLILTNPDSRQVTGATVTVRGLTAKGRITQTLATPDDSSDAARTLTVRFSAGPGNAVSADLWAPGLTAVQMVELNSVTYADGSTWKLADSSVCRTVPDKLMPIGNR